MARKRYPNSNSAMMPTITVSILSPYNFSQNTVYKALVRKNAMITPMKIKSLIRVNMRAT